MKQLYEYNFWDDITFGVQTFILYKSCGLRIAIDWKRDNNFRGCGGWNPPPNKKDSWVEIDPPIWTPLKLRNGYPLYIICWR